MIRFVRAALLLAAALSPSVAGAQPVELSFQEVVRRTRAGNPLVDRALAKVQELEARADAARLAWMGRGSWTNDFAVVPVCEKRPSDPLECRDELDTAGDLLELGAEPHLRGRVFYGWPVWTFGKITAGRSLGEAGVQAGEANVEAVRDQTTYLAKKAFWGALLAAELAGIARDGLKRLDAARERIEALLEEDSDDVDERDAWRLTVYRSSVIGQVRAADRARALSLAGIREATGVPADRPLRLSGALAPLVTTLPALDAVVQRAVQGNREAKAATAVVQARLADVELKRSQLWPDLTFGFAAYYRTTPFLDTDAECIADLEDGGARCEAADLAPLPVPALRLEWRLDLPNQLSALRRAQAAVEIARADARALQAKLRLGVEEAWRRAADARAHVDGLRDAVKAARRLVVGATMDHEVGVGSPAALRDALVAWAKSRAARSTSVRDLNVAVADLSRLVGGDLEKIPAPPASKETGGTPP